MEPPRPIAEDAPETFIMRHPSHRYTDNTDKRTSDDNVCKRWRTLRDTIVALGGEVLPIPGRHTERTELSDPMYVRDIAVYLPHLSGRNLLFSGMGGTAMNERKRMLSDFMERQEAWHQATGPGYFEGGNLIYSPAHNAIFWGVSNNQYLTINDDQWQKKLQGTPPEEQHRERLNVKLRHVRYESSGLRRTGADLQQNEGMRVAGKACRVIPMFIPDSVSPEFYHLDGVLGVLPSGHAVVCRELLSKTALRALEQVIGPENIIPISAEEARKGSTNFITIGDHIVTPYASPQLKEKLHASGYQVIDPPSQGLPSNEWEFGPGAFVRCATLKITPDRGFPQVAPALQHQR